MVGLLPPQPQLPLFRKNANWSEKPKILAAPCVFWNQSVSLNANKYPRKLVQMFRKSNVKLTTNRLAIQFMNKNATPFMKPSTRINAKPCQIRNVKPCKILYALL